MSNTATTSVMAPLVVSLFASLRSAVGGEDVGDLVEKVFVFFFFFSNKQICFLFTFLFLFLFFFYF